MSTTRIGCTVEVVIEHGVITGLRTMKGYVVEEDINIEAGPPNLELCFGNDGRLACTPGSSPAVKIFERIVSAMTTEFPQDDNSVVL